MAQLCSKCSRANPPEAVYCYFDGFVLAAHGRTRGPRAMGTQLFSSPFVFSSGRTCRTFDELAMACQEHWAAACELLRDGFLESFLGGLGRLDLAGAAKEAARFPDAERGLDQLLEKLPSSVLDEPKLRVDPIEVNLGLLEPGKERQFELELENQGMRLLYGTASSAEAVWLTLGEAGATEKHFQFTHELKVPVHVRSDRVRASTKPIEARLVVESNGGTVTVVVRAEKPIKPFPDGPLKGARTPRQVAEIALKHSKEVAPLFETGEIEKWYASNGWIYPVKIPAASGVASIQQFFEALGFTRPPKVEISHTEFNLQADPGTRVALSLDVSTQEKRPAWAHAVSTVPWLEVTRPRFNGKSTTVPITILSVPDRPGETLQGEVKVIANGNKRWVVPVRLEITGAAFDFTSRPAPPPPPPPPPPSAKPSVVMEVPPLPPKSAAATEVPPLPAKKVPPPPTSKPQPRRPRSGTPVWIHAIPALLLVLAILGVAGFDLAIGSKKGSSNPDGSDDAGEGWNFDVERLRDKNPRLGVEFNRQRRFGVVMLDARDPRNKDAWKKLTFAPSGDTNNTIVKIAGFEYYFGQTTPSNGWEGPSLQPLPAPRRGWVSQMSFRTQKIRVTQHVEIVPGQTRLLDTCLVYYKAHNYGTIPQKVGVRVLLDTFIGANDGVPFTIPGRKDFVTTKETLEGDKIPDYIEIVERPDDPKDPGTTARLALKGIRLPGIELVDPDVLRICRFPGEQARWDWVPQDMGDDSCVVVYWPDEALQPRTSRHMAFTYGLGNLDIGDRLALSFPPAVVPNREFVITCYVYNSSRDQKVKLDLPEGLELAGGDTAEKVVDTAAARTQVFWRVRATRDGTFPVSATSGASRSRETSVVVKAGSIFG